VLSILRISSVLLLLLKCNGRACTDHVCTLYWYKQLTIRLVLWYSIVFYDYLLETKAMRISRYLGSLRDPLFRGKRRGA
jgi:hypothetical protein